MQTCDVTEVNSGATFTIRCDDIILDGALAQGISLPHQCRGASCGTCKARVIEGEVDHGWSLGDALSDEEKSRGYCLLCQARPVTDTLRIETVAPVQSPSEVRERKAEVASVVNLTPRVKRVVLALPAHEDFRYPAGAYVEFQLDGVTPNRMYSLASPEREDGLLEFWVARHPEGLASGYIHDELAVGDSVRILGPFGHCRMPGGSGPVIGLAGGTGLAPVLAIFEDALRRGATDDLLLVLSVREVREVFAQDRIMGLARRYPNFRYQVLVTDEPSRYTDTPMLATTWLLAHYRSLVDYRIVIGGSPGFVDACIAACLSLGVAGTSIAVDSFVPVGSVPATSDNTTVVGRE